MSIFRKVFFATGLLRKAAGPFLIAFIACSTMARGAEPRIDYIIKTNVNKVDIHFGTEANRSYVLQAINPLPCGTNANCPGNGVASNNWTNLLTVFASPLPTNHYIYRDGATNKGRFYRLRVTP